VIPRRPRLTALVLLAAVLTSGGAVAGAATPAARTDKAATACALLTEAEIASVFRSAPLDPGPHKVRIPNARRNFSRCEWDDREVPTTTQLAVYTGLARTVKAGQLRGLGVAATGTTARDLTPEELQGLGDRGAVELIHDGTYGSISIVRGNDVLYVSSAYQGPAPLPQVTEADMLAVARLAAARL
jgi:hypothetical protein